MIILPAELSAAAVLINFWNKEINNAVWIVCPAFSVPSDAFELTACIDNMFDRRDRHQLIRSQSVWRVRILVCLDQGQEAEK